MIYPDETQTPEAIADHYNDLDPYYRKLWGERLHHGYFKYGNESVQQATEALMELVIETGKIDENCRVLDIGCGYGTTSQYLAHTIGATATAVTASKSQWQYARSHDPESTNPRYILGDFLHNDFKPDTYDAAISIESLEHTANKEKFFSEVVRLLKPGGRFVAAISFAKPNPNSWEIRHLLKPICQEGRLPSIGSLEEYEKMMAQGGLLDVEFRDITKQVKKTWSLCAWRMTKALFSDKKVRRYLLDKKSKERIFAKIIFRIWIAYTLGTMRYGILSAIKH